MSRTSHVRQLIIVRKNRQLTIIIVHRKQKHEVHTFALLFRVTNFSPVRLDDTEEKNARALGT